MGHTRRTQLLMKPDEFRRLKAEAVRRKKSVAELIRAAVQKEYFSSHVDRHAVLQEILKIRVRLPSWKRLKKQLESRHDDLPG